ncbi:hypothetical protein GCM10010393_31240 [Streptomyces gobitricini]|uniref:Glyoxalase-like domain-containing protein n=1 Tax=Streptomyces gobitricini TaxID=68211 RepID=A0ABN3M736_9ACTN
MGDTVVLAFDPTGRLAGDALAAAGLRPGCGRCHSRCCSHGAQVVTEVADSAWGDRGGRMWDPFGNIWWVVSRIEDVAPDQVWERMLEPKYAEAMRTAPGDAGCHAEGPGFRGGECPAAHGPLALSGLVVLTASWALPAQQRDSWQTGSRPRPPVTARSFAWRPPVDSAHSETISKTDNRSVGLVRWWRTRPPLSRLSPASRRRRLLACCSVSVLERADW